jgi:hypothetical protein
MNDIKHYDGNGIFFIYPDNWTLEENEPQANNGSIQLSNGDGAFWLLQKYPLGTNPDDIAESVMNMMRAEYEDIEVERFDRVQFDKNITGYEITFFYLDLMNQAQIHCFEQDGEIYAVFWQTGNQLIIQIGEEIPMDRVLEAVTLSFLRGKPHGHHHHDGCSCGCQH